MTNVMSKGAIVLIALVLIGAGYQQNCRQCKYQAVFGGLVYLGFLKAPNLGLIMTLSFLLTQLYASKFIKKGVIKR